MNTESSIEQTPCIKTQLINDLINDVNDDVIKLLLETIDAVKSSESNRVSRMRAQAERRRVTVVYYARQSTTHPWIRLQSTNATCARYEVDRMGCMIEIGKNYGNSQPQQIIIRRNQRGKWVSVNDRIPTKR